MRSRDPKPSKDSGFSLVELLISVGIIAVISLLGTTFVTNTLKESTFRSQQTQARTELTAVLKQLSDAMATRNQLVDPVQTATSLQISMPVDSIFPPVYYERTMVSGCRAAPDGTSGFHIAPTSKGIACYNQLNCAGQLPFIQITYVGHPTRSIEKIPNDAHFAEVTRREYAVAGIGVCIENLAEGFAFKGIAAIMDTRNSAGPSIHLVEETLVLPRDKRNGVDLVPR